MYLSDYLKKVASDVALEEWEVQLNYQPVEPSEWNQTQIKNEDIVRLAKEFEIPKQYIVGED